MTSGSEYASALERSFAELLALYDKLTPAQIEQGAVGDGWTPKTLLADVAYRDDFQTRACKMPCLA